MNVEGLVPDRTLTFMSMSGLSVELSYSTLLFRSVSAVAVSTSSQLEMYDQNSTPNDERNK